MSTKAYHNEKFTVSYLLSHRNGTQVPVIRLRHLVLYSRIIKDYTMDRGWIMRCKTSTTQLLTFAVKAEAPVFSHQELKRLVSEWGTVPSWQAHESIVFMH
ncbi:hypothetical protein LB506_007647 [Fusarium annulatum]|nr:hypothetical protein LB506_007647 [Fusarium annulatum]